MAKDDTQASEAEEIQEALAASEERFRFLSENIPVQIWTALPTGEIEYVTKQTADRLGVSVQQLLEDGWQNVVHPEDLPLAIERWTHALTTGETYEVEFRLKLAGGNYAAHLARAVPHRDEGGAIVRWFGTNTNMDEQREAQRQTEALLVEVGRQLQESETAFAALREKYQEALAQISELEARTKGSND